MTRFEQAKAPEVQPQRVEGSRHTIPQAFERYNAPQMRRDWIESLPPVWLLLLSAFVCLFALLTANVVYSRFFEWVIQ